MERSWFSKAAASEYRLVADSSHELPRWRSPSPMAASMIPPPIVQSSYAGSPRLTQKSVVLQRAPPPPVDDRQSEIEADLQFLLDAQAEGLIQGWDGPPQSDDHVSTGSTTPTAQSVRSVSERRKTRPSRKKPGLRSARKGIYNSILALSAVKREELQGLDADAREKEHTLAQIDEWEQKRLGLEEATRHVDEGEDTVRSQRLRQEADVLQEEINAVELQLQDLKARHRKLLRHAAAAENEVQAKLASYTSSLSLLDTDVHKFLGSRSQTGERRPQSRDGKTSVWQLPAKRRTLEMAREQFIAEKDAILQDCNAIDLDKTALDEGAAVWKDVTAHVTDFEKRMRTSMTDLSSSQSAWDEEPHANDNSDRLRELLTHLDTVVKHLDTQFKLAEDRSWKLLIAAIGAELEALRQGKQILQNVLGVTEPKAEPEAQDLVDTRNAPTNGSSPAEEADTGDRGEAIYELNRSFETARPPRRQASDSEDDPDPELLFSRRDEEGE